MASNDYAISKDDTCTSQMSDIEQYMKSQGWGYEIRDRPLVLAEFYVKGSASDSIKMRNKKDIKEVSTLDPNVFLTAFNPEQLITKTNQLPRADMRDIGVLNFYNKIIDKLSATDS